MNFKSSASSFFKEIGGLFGEDCNERAPNGAYVSDLQKYNESSQFFEEHKDEMAGLCLVEENLDSNDGTSIGKLHHEKYEIHFDNGEIGTIEKNRSGLNIEAGTTRGYKTICYPTPYKVEDIHKAAVSSAQNKYNVFFNNCQDFTKDMKNYLDSKK